MREYIEKVASGLRAMKNPPDAMLCCLDGDLTWNEPTICGIPVLHSAFIQNTMSDDVPFIPLWYKEGNHAMDRKRFNDYFYS